MNIKRTKLVRRFSGLLLAIYGLRLVFSSLLEENIIVKDISNVFQSPDIFPSDLDLVKMFLGLILLAASRGLLRGQRNIYVLVIFVLFTVSVIHLVNTRNIIDVLAPFFIIGFYLLNNKYFQAHVSLNMIFSRLIRLGIIALVIPFIIALIFATEVRFQNITRIDFTHFMLGQSLPIQLQVLLLVINSLLALGLGWAITIPNSNNSQENIAPNQEIRNLVKNYGLDSLSYFSLRSDKSIFQTADGFVSYRVINGICLVSPEPIGKDPFKLWKDFSAMARNNGWPIVFIGARNEFSQTLKTEGMLIINAGDEAIVDVKNYSLVGHDKKPLRLAVNRMKRNGYQTVIKRVSELTTDETKQVKQIAPITRVGNFERGFSMTLGRIAEKEDDLIMVMVKDQDQQICGFAQFVPAPELNGFSLDITRRDGKDHPNGMIELAFYDFFQYLSTNNYDKVSLNFSPLKNIFLGQTKIPGLFGFDLVLLKLISRQSQFTTLYKFNAKFLPSWHSRFIALDGIEYLWPAVVAVLTAEGITEIPILGWFIKRRLNRIA